MTTPTLETVLRTTGLVLIFSGVEDVAGVDFPFYTFVGLGLVGALWNRS
jgi:hypothetical protein